MFVRCLCMLDAGFVLFCVMHMCTLWSRDTDNVKHWLPVPTQTAASASSTQRDLLRPDASSSGLLVRLVVPSPSRLLRRCSNGWSPVSVDLKRNLEDVAMLLSVILVVYEEGRSIILA